MRPDDMLDDNIFFLIKMPLESVDVSRVNVEGDNINLTAADSFDVAAERRAMAGERRKGLKEENEEKTLET